MELNPGRKKGYRDDEKKESEVGIVKGSELSSS